MSVIVVRDALKAVITSRTNEAFKLANAWRAKASC